MTYPPGVTNTADWLPPDTEEIAIDRFGGQLPDDTQLFRQVRVSGFNDSKTVLWWPLKRVSVIAGSDLQNAFRSSGEWGDPAV